MSTYATAAALAGKGWHVFPCKPKSKHPATEHGFKDASCDVDQITRWWERTPDANLAVATGADSGIVVLDVDDLDGLSELTAEYGPLPETMTAQTGSGGLHLFFAHPGVPVGNRARFFPGLDVRGDGGYVILPPSVHPSGTDYLWMTKGVPPATMPDWLLELVARKVKSTPAGEVRLTESNSKWGEAVLAGELPKVAQAIDGTRNHELFRAAAAVFGAVKGGQLDKSTAWTALTHAASTAGLDQRETERTLDSAWGTSDPREPTARPDRVLPTVSPQEPQEPDEPDGEFVWDRRWPIYDADELHLIPKPTWVIGGYITAGLTVVYGPSGSGKSFLTVDWSLAAARGVRWLGTDVPARPVVYVAAEGAGGLQSRVEAWKKHHSQKGSGLHVIPTRVNLLDHNDVCALERDVEEKGAGLVVLDTLARCMPGGDENSAQDIGRVIDAVDGIRNRQGCGVILVHHSGVDGTRPRGSTALFGACDTVVRVDGEHDENTDALEHVTVKCDKQKDAKPFPRATFVPETSGDSVVLVETQRRARSMIGSYS